MAAGEDTFAGWKAALARAALPGAASVILTRSTGVEDGVPTTAYKLTSVSESGDTIGDDRDYDLLKAVMMPLERLAEAEGGDPLKVRLDVSTGKVTVSVDG